MKKTFVYMLLGVNILLLTFLSAFIFFGFKQKDLFKTIEAEEIIIRGPRSKSIISLKATKNTPEITILDENGKTKIYVNKMGLYLKNDKDKIIGSFTSLADEGGGLGLADSNGMASSIIRGGSNPSLSLFGNKADPLASFGVVNNIPNLIVSAENGNEGLLLHGGKRSGMMLLDELGKLKVFICKDGIYQGKEEELEQEHPQKRKYFSHKQDKELLFPDSEGNILR